MIINKKGESLVGIIVGVFILSFVLLGIGNLIGNSRDNIDEFDKQINIDILSKNSYKIINTLDLSILNDGDIFYINKDKPTGKFNIYVGNINKQYKYINKFGEKIDNPISYNGNVYERTFKANKININGKEKTIINVSVEKYYK